MDDGERDHALEPFELPENQRPVRPGAGERDDEMIAPRLRFETAGSRRPRRAVGRHPVAERRVGADEVSASIVREILFGAPDALLHVAHLASSPRRDPPLPAIARKLAAFEKRCEPGGVGCVVSDFCLPRSSAGDAGRSDCRSREKLRRSMRRNCQPIGRPC